MSQQEAPRAGFLPSRAIHLHPSRFCNLACQHCYSESGPNQRHAVSVDKTIAALAQLRTEGYEVVSLSGGEPLLYTGFEPLVKTAVSLGYRVNLVTNGAPIGGWLLAMLESHIDTVAISLDGAPDTHNRLRAHPRAFALAERGMERLRQRGIPFGFSFCVSRQSLPEMPWVVDFARDRGAAMVQFHPFAAVGRGQQLAGQLDLDRAARTRAYAIASLLRSDDGPHIQIDLAPLTAVQAQQQDYAILTAPDATTQQLSTLINPLVITEKGELLPLSYGFNPAYGLGNINSQVAESVAAFKSDGWRHLRTVVQQAFACAAHETGFIDWFHHLVQTSYMAADVQLEYSVN